MSPLRMPTPLVRGSRIRVIAPSSPFDRALVLRGMGWLGERYHVEFSWSIFERRGFLAGDDARRLDELNAALRDPSLAAIIAARGGYGLTRIAHLADLAALARSPKWLVGFSDVTALHVEALNVGVGSMHAHNVAGMGRGDAGARSAFVRALEHPEQQQCFANLEVWRAGSACGPLVGGNLTVLFTCHAAGRLHLPRGAVLALEDVTESSYRIDRMLSALRAAGVLDLLAGIVVGDFTDCGAGQHGVPVRDVLMERLCGLGVPILAGLPFGHGRTNEPLCLGALATLDGTRARVILGADAP
ncbi:MAG TPA: LD-carboxypeptidase [Polyangiaceae bacterium]|jgi:muramoyltetrapeptide carboxypeptidase